MVSVYADHMYTIPIKQVGTIQTFQLEQVLAFIDSVLDRVH